MRVYLLYLFILFFSLYAWRNCFVSLCASVALMGFIGHDDMPRTLGGIQGLSPWNILFLNVLLAWLVQRRRHGLRWDMPPRLAASFAACFLVLNIGFLRLWLDPGEWPEQLSIASCVSEYLVNSVKWVLPGLIFYDVCRSRKHVRFALFAVLAIYFLLAIQAIRYVPWSLALSGGDDVGRRAYKAVQNGVGLNRVTLSMMLGGACWAILSSLLLCRTRASKLGLIAAAGIVAFGQALTGGRTGYISWLVVGIALGIIRWRRFLFIIPIVAALIVMALPGVRNRILMGVGQEHGAIVTETDRDRMTSGRTKIWPYVIEKIGEAPLFGYGRLAMRTTGLTQWLGETIDEDGFGHPHNAYLEQLLDNGIFGFFLVAPALIVVFGRSLNLLRDRSDPLVGAVGGVAFALLLALLVGAMGGQTFYPREGSVGMWAAIGIMLRVSVEHRRSLLKGTPLFGEESEEELEQISVASELSPQPV